MRVVDEEGRLFGRVNVVDALVVVLLLGAVGAGLVVLDPFAEGGRDDGEAATRYATVDLGSQPASIADRIGTGDATAGNGLTVTDTYVGPATGGNASVVVRVRIDGTVVEDGGQAASVFEFDGDALRTGDEVPIDTGAYDVRGEVLALGSSGERLETGTLDVLLEATVPGPTASEIARGDRYRIGNHTVATIEEAVVAAGGTASNRTAMLGLSLRTIRHSGSTYFGDAKLAVGDSLDVRTDRYALSGSLTRWGNASVPWEPTTRTVVVSVEDVAPRVADGLAVGMTERRDGATIARISAVRTEPATVVLTSDDGRIYEREHPTRVNVHLSVELRLRQTEDGLRFRLRPLREGDAVALDFRTIAVEGTVTDVEE